MTSRRTTLRIGPVDVHLPDASVATFSFMHDLAGLFGLETNADAEAALRASIKVLAGKARLEIDHEADYVFVDARTADALLVALRAVEHAARRPIFTTEQIERARSAMLAWKRPKPVSYVRGDLAAVPLGDGTYGVVHTLAPRDFVVLDARADSVDGARRLLASNAGKPVACRSFSDDEILSGEWPLVGRREPDSALSDSQYVEGKSSGGSVVLFLESFFGLRPWDALFDCDEHDEWLLPEVVPQSRRLRRDIFKVQLRAAHGETPPRVDAGAATIHLLIAYKGGGRPRVIDKPKIRGVAERIRPVTQELWTGGGDGFFDLFARVADVQALHAAFDRVAVELRIADDTILECYAPFDVDWDLATIERKNHE